MREIRSPGSVRGAARKGRPYRNQAHYQGPLGHGWHHSYDQRLCVEDDVILYQTPEGRQIGFPKLKTGEEHFDRSEKLTLTRDALGSGYSVRDSEGLVRWFVAVEGRSRTELPLVKIQDAAGRGIELRYDPWGRLSEIIDTGGRSIGLEYDQAARLMTLTAPHPELVDQRLWVARYVYDGSGNLAGVYDALGHSTSYRYQRHLLVGETDKNGLSFYFAYDGADETARCVRTWGDGGIYDHKLARGSKTAGPARLAHGN